MNIRKTLLCFFIFSLGATLFAASGDVKKDEATGLIIDDGYELVVGNCTSCHSAALVTQNRGDKQNWEEMIVWMQKTQGLWDLGDMKEPILNYLAKNYGPTKASRRGNITVTEWYEIKK